MNLVTFFFFPAGRIEPGPFLRAVVAVYAAGFVSQALLAQPVLARLGVAPFLLVHGAVVWSWYALHVRRLRDAGLGAVGAIAVVAFYALAVAAFIVLFGLWKADAGGEIAADTIFVHLFVVGSLIDMLLQSPGFGLFFYFALAALALALVPTATALALTAWSATRPSVDGPVA